MISIKNQFTISSMLIHKHTFFVYGSSSDLCFSDFFGQVVEYCGMFADYPMFKIMLGSHAIVALTKAETVEVS